MAFIRNGFSTLIEFGGLGIQSFLVEKTVTPPGIEGGGPINITNMRNTRWRTQVPKSLLTFKNITLTVQYDPAFYGLAAAQMQVIAAMSITFPDASILVFYAWIEDLSVPEHKEGEEPLVTVTICPSMYYGGIEVEPQYAP